MHDSRDIALMSLCVSSRNMTGKSERKAISQRGQSD